MDTGNSSELVSKFIGHTNTDTTLKYYWIKNIEDLAREINNPFLSTYKDEDEKKADYIEELVASKKKIDTLLEIIHIYNLEIQSSIEKTENALNVKNNIFNKIPDLEKLLQIVVDSTYGSTTTYLSSL